MTAFCVRLMLAGCDNEGSVSESQETIQDRSLSAVAGPTDPTQLRPVARVARAQYGVVGPFPLDATDLDAFMLIPKSGVP